MERTLLFPAVLLLLGLPAAFAAVRPPGSPEAMAAATERWMVEGAGARFPDGMAAPASEGDFVFVDGTWPLPFRDRVGEAVSLRVSPETGCYEFADADGAVFWTVVPVAPLTWNWISPFRSPLRPDTQDLYSPFRLAREWLLLSPAETADGGASSPSEPPRLGSHAKFAEFESHAESAEFSGRARPPGAPRLESHAESAENAEPFCFGFDLDLGFVDNGGQLRFVDNPTSICFTAFSYTETNLFFAAAWPTNETLPQSVLDLYGSTNLARPGWTFLSSHPATNPPVSFSIDPAALPWYVEPTQHVHDATCDVATNVVLSPLDGVTVYTNVVWSCATNRTPVPPGFFQLGTRHDLDGDGLFDSFELLVLGTRPDRLDSDGDGVPDGVAAAEWLSNPLWATNDMDADFIVDIVAPSDGSAETVLTLDGWRIPLSPPAGSRAFSLPPGEIVPCSVSSSGPFFILWAGTSGGSFWGLPESFEKPFWTDGIGNVSGYHTESGSCQIAVPVLTVEPDFGGGLRSGGSANGSHIGPDGSVCVHAADGIQRYTWSIAPAVVAAGRTPTATGAVQIESGNPFIDVSAASNVLSGSFGFGPCSTAGGGTLWGSLTNVLAAHRCDATLSFPYCSVCGCPGSQIAPSISISQDYRYALFGTTNMSRFAATVQGGGTNDIVWTVSPGWGDYSKLHGTSDPYSTGYVELSGVAQIWADSGFSTNVNTVTASISSGTNACATATFTSIAVDAEAVCNERATDGSVVNPICIPVGESAVFRAKVFPESVPDSDLHWIVSGGHAGITGSHYGREVVLEGTSTGEVQLDLVISGYNGPNPRFRVFVMPMRAVPVVAWITCDDVGTPVVLESQIGQLLNDANALLRQVCVSCYVHQVSYTNCQDWLRLENYGSLDFWQKATAIVSVSNNVGGIEMHFVERIDEIAGLNTSGGIVLPAETSGRALAHEIGHAFGLRDIYDEHDYAVGSVVGRVRKNRCQDDWTGDDERGFYKNADTLPQAELIHRLVMYGYADPDSADFSWGNVEGLAKGQSNPNSVTLQTVPVGIFPNGSPPNPHHD